MQDISLNLDKAIESVKTRFGDSSDLNIVKLRVSGVKCAILTLEGMVKNAELAKMLFEPLMEFKRKGSTPKDVFKFLSCVLVASTDQKKLASLSEICEMLCSGFAVVLVNGIPLAMAYGAHGFAQKGISEPASEADVKGTHEALSDSLRSSMALIRRRMKSPKLRFEILKAGKLSQTQICLVYIDGKTPEKLKNKVKRGLQKVDLELVLTSGSLIPYIEERAGSFFSGVSTTERPDTLCAKINEGRVAVLIDGVPYALVCPTLFIENFQTVDDYSEKPFFATYQRWVRVLAFLSATLLPGFYVASALHHPEVLSRALHLNLIASQKNTPYSLIVEMLIVIVMFEILREAGLRLPRAIGGTVSIVGGLVIGDAAVKSGLISAPLLIIIGITATSAFALPSLNPQLTILRIINVFAGGYLGFFGLAAVMIVMLSNASRTYSFGVPYTAPLTPFTFKAMRDVVTRVGFKKLAKDIILLENLNGCGGEDGKDD